ncbi:MAG: hypothetical protein KDD10_11160 [Phaeodactylibacter sp.]|nr:hypothetical protein [Phaeodactylibacter sp.]MCB9295946.1 hypothetical protein [Lewinellaceae bacterium]
MPSTAKQTPWMPNEAENLLPHHEMILVPGGSFMMGDDEGDSDYVGFRLALPLQSGG